MGWKRRGNYSSEMLSPVLQEGEKKEHFSQVSENDIADVGYYSIHCKIIFRGSSGILNSVLYTRQGSAAPWWGRGLVQTIQERNWFTQIHISLIVTTVWRHYVASMRHGVGSKITEL